MKKSTKTTHSIELTEGEVRAWMIRGLVAAGHIDDSQQFGIGVEWTTEYDPDDDCIHVFGATVRITEERSDDD